jgi:hypothetical protein
VPGPIHGEIYWELETMHVPGFCKVLAAY